jgi:hypothetical protein
MKIWNFTAGWQLKKRIELIIIGLAVILSGGNISAKQAADNPSMEMLEFLGSFETAGGKEIDPMKLQDEPAKQKAASRPAVQGPKEESGKIKGKGGGNE